MRAGLRAYLHAFMYVCTNVRRYARIWVAAMYPRFCDLDEVQKLLGLHLLELLEWRRVGTGLDILPCEDAQAPVFLPQLRIRRPQLQDLVNGHLCVETGAGRERQKRERIRRVQSRGVKP